MLSFFSSNYFGFFMTSDELYSAFFEAISNKEIEKINSLLTIENINLLKNSYLSKDERYQKLCVESLSLDNQAIFMRLCTPALKLLESDDMSSIDAASVAQIFLPRLIKELVWQQKKMFVDGLITACIVNEIENFSSDQSKVNFNSIAKICMLIAAVIAYEDLAERKDHPGWQDAAQLKNDYVRTIRHLLDCLLNIHSEEQLNKKVFITTRQRILSACFAQGADNLASEFINNDEYWLKADPDQRNKDKVFGTTLSVIVIDRLDLIKKYLNEVDLNEFSYMQLLKATIFHNKQNIFDYILFKFGEKINIQKILTLVNEARIHYNKNSHYFDCLLDCNWLNENKLEKKAVQLRVIAYALISFEDEQKKLPKLLENFTTEDLQLLRDVDSKLHDSFCEKLKDKYPRLFVSRMSECTYNKVKNFISEFKNFIRLDSSQQQNIVFDFNSSGAYAQFMGEWHRKYGNNYTPSIELRFIKKEKKVEVVISKTTKLSLIQVEGFCEMIKSLTEQIEAKLKPVKKSIAKKTVQSSQAKKLEDCKISNVTKKQLRAEKRKLAEDKKQIEFRDSFFKLLKIHDSDSLFEEQPKEFFLRNQIV